MRSGRPKASICDLNGTTLDGQMGVWRVILEVLILGSKVSKKVCGLELGPPGVFEVRRRWWAEK